MRNQQGQLKVAGMLVALVVAAILIMVFTVTNSLTAKVTSDVQESNKNTFSLGIVNETHSSLTAGQNITLNTASGQIDYSVSGSSIIVTNATNMQVLGEHTNWTFNYNSDQTIFVNSTDSGTDWNISYTYSATTQDSAYNISREGLQAQQDLGENTSSVAQIIVISIIIGLLLIVVGYFGIKRFTE